MMDICYEFMDLSLNNRVLGIFYHTLLLEIFQCQLHIRSIVLRLSGFF